jgi:hypothetical protein
MEEIDSTKFATKIITLVKDGEKDIDLDPQNEEFISLNKKSYRTLRKAFKLNLTNCKDKTEAQNEIDWARSMIIKKYINRYGKKELIAYKFEFSLVNGDGKTCFIILKLVMLLEK